MRPLAIYHPINMLLLNPDFSTNEWYGKWELDTSSDLLDEAKSMSKGLEIRLNLELALGIPTGANNQKVKNAYDWAKNSDNEIPKILAP